MEKKISFGFSASLQIYSAALKSPRYFILCPLWWGWMQLCCTSFQISSEGTLSWSQTLIIDKHMTAWAANPQLQLSSIRLWTNSIKVWRCVGQVNHRLYILLSACQLSANTQTESLYPCLKNVAFMQQQLALVQGSTSLVFFVSLFYITLSPLNFKYFPWPLLSRRKLTSLSGSKHWCVFHSTCLQMRWHALGWL